MDKAKLYVDDWVQEMEDFMPFGLDDPMKNPTEFEVPSLPHSAGEDLKRFVGVVDGLDAQISGQRRNLGPVGSIVANRALDSEQSDTDMCLLGECPCSATGCGPTRAPGFDCEYLSQFLSESHNFRIIS